MPQNELASIRYSFGDETVADFTKGDRYVLSLDYSEVQEVAGQGILDTLFWVLTAPDGSQSYLYQLSPVHIFQSIGRYIIDSYELNKSLLATDTISVLEGEYIAFEFISEFITEGEDVIVLNKSTFKNATHEWVVLTDKGNELLIDTSDTLTVSSLDAGDYSVELRLYQKGEKLKSASKNFIINKKAAVPKPRPAPVRTNPVVVNPRPKTIPTETPKPAPKAKAPSDGWYTADKGYGKFTVGSPAPKKDKANFSGGTVIIELAPKADMQLSSFSFWGNHNTGNYTILYECISCKENNQKRLRPFVYRTGNDFYEPQTRFLDSKSIGFRAGHTYKITFTTQESTEMQFEKLDKTKYENENLTLEFLTDRSSVFGLTFLKRQE